MQMDDVWLSNQNNSNKLMMLGACLPNDHHGNPWMYGAPNPLATSMPMTLPTML
ncbi:unnamed protein product, partial [Anisakis simplex]|uniref:DUF1559 domain-containing protein n=1 Tax=Anisakis simplex TaxID=6269 RepID=A0A0M3J2D0_ANISI